MLKQPAIRQALGSSLPLALFAFYLLLAGCSSSKDGGEGKSGGTAKGSTKGHVNMTVAEFRKAVFNESEHSGRWEPKRTFFSKFGEPLRVMDVGDDTHLIYQCKDGKAAVKAPIGPYHHQDLLVAVAVDQK